MISHKKTPPLLL